jgi:putative transposase
MSTQLTKRRAYDSDVTDEQWSVIEPYLPCIQSNTNKGGRPAKYTRREIFNAILYVVRTGCQWRLLPHDFPHYKTVYTYFRNWHEQHIFEEINTILRKQVRVNAQRNAEPTAGVIDSQSVKIVGNIGFSGFDGAKKVNGRKRHIVTDTLGLLLSVTVHKASLSDRASAPMVLAHVRAKIKTLSHIFADQGYTGQLIDTVKTTLQMTIEIIKRTEVRVFHILPRRWVVERTFGWFGFYRRLSKDYERYPQHSEAFVYLASLNICLHRLHTG